MAAEDFKRKLTAILSADVEGYSRLMGDDEEATVQTITSYREVIATVVEKHRGRVVDSPGDNILAEFASVVDAVKGAVKIQEELKVRNADLPENRRMEFRIGVNLGDVIHEEERIYGDGVNVAARVESLSEAGGICVSGTAFDHIETKLPLGYEYLGEQSVKNIAKPVRVYKVLMDPEAAGKVIGEERAKPRRGQGVALSVVTALLLVVAGLSLWKVFLSPSLPPIEVASKRTLELDLSSKPALAVLPFDNMSEDHEQEYFSDGMTDDLITDLSKISGLFVIARNSTFTYKGKPVKVQQVAEDLGVRYVLEGSVRKAGETVRINAQLIDASTGVHIWAERYDGQVGNIFSLQDRITKQIVAALEVQLTADDERRFAAKETTSKEAYDAFLHGWQHYLTRTPEDLKKAVEYFKKAIEIDPDYGRAYAALALTYWRGAGYGWARKMGMSSYNEARIRAVNVMEMAMKKPTSIAHRLAADMLIHKRRYEEAIAEAERALVLDPNDSENYLVMGRVLRDLGRPEVAINYFKRAMLLNPLDKAFSLGGLGLAQFCMGQFEDTVAACEEGLKNRPEATAIASGLAAAYGQLGREQEARAALEIYKMGWGRISPHLPKVMYFFPFKNPKHAELFANGLLNAGLPGKPSGYFKVSDERRLKGEEIKSLFFGKKMVGHAGKRQWRIERAQDGEAKFWYGSKFLGSGKSWVEGDDLCNQWEKVFGGVKYCMDAYRNPEGTPEQKNDYFLITDYGMFGCSPEDLEG